MVDVQFGENKRRVNAILLLLNLCLLCEYIFLVYCEEKWVCGTGMGK